MFSSSPQIEETDFGDGDRAYTVELPIVPYGTALFTAPDLTPASRKLLVDLINRWDALWPDMLEQLQERMTDYDIDQKLGEDEFMGFVSPMEKDVYMGDKSDVHLRLDFDQAPLWDYFLKGSTIVHFQPVF